jgi:5-formyltetrahydrofolate cyclo-ligase
VVILDKKVIRKKMLEERAKISSNDILEKSSAIKDTLFSLSQYKESNFIFSFISFKDEVNTHEIIKDSISSKNKRIVGFRNNRF